MHTSHNLLNPLSATFLYLYPTKPYFPIYLENQKKKFNQETQDSFYSLNPFQIVLLLTQQRRKEKEFAMEVALELEDDLFFADLSKQISLLIMDDDEIPVSTCPSVSFQSFSRGNYPAANSSPFMYEQQPSRRESKGTGVFIPRSAQPRKKQRQARYSAVNTKKQQQQNDSSRTVSQTNSFNPKKF